MKNTYQITKKLLSIKNYMLGQNGDLIDIFFESTIEFNID